MSKRFDDLDKILEAAIFAAGEPVALTRLAQLFPESARPSNKEIRDTLKKLSETMETRGVELVEVASGYRFQAKTEYAPWLKQLWEKKPPRYSRALLETLALIVYRQPITRAEIEDVRGVAVSSNIIKTLLDRQWVKIVGHKEVPGRPALFASTKQFLDYFNLKSLSELPTLPEPADLDALEEQLSTQLNLPVASAETETDESNIEAALNAAELVLEAEAPADNVVDITRVVESRQHEASTPETPLEGETNSSE
ncbi:MAG: SMC-Scp complex subunit ScpB [Gammaproteobacteria bacterium]|nr:SMC-Scp complex subunit ScpB [Gammaproteobacteria bacterium]